MKELLSDIRKCQVCLPFLAHGVNPVVAAHKNSKIAVIGQAPGSVVHKTGIPWDDKSGERLRDWLGVSDEQFYNPEIFALIPMGFCYPGKAKTGDLPPRRECAPLWHHELFSRIDNLEMSLLIGNYAQNYYLGEMKKKTLTETVKNFTSYFPKFLPLPHPSPRNNIWLKKNAWFGEDVLPVLKHTVQDILAS